MWMEFIFPIIWMLSVAIYRDETIINLKCHHADNIRMMYKAEGDGLQAYALCKKGYTYQIFMFTYPASTRY